MGPEKSLGTTLTKTKSGTELEDLVIANLTTIGRVGIESDEIETTTLDSTGGFREFIAGFKDAGEVSLSGIIKSEVALSAMIALADSQSIEAWVINTPSGSQWKIDGFVKMFEEGEAAIDSVRTFNGSIRITGKPVYIASGASV